MRLSALSQRIANLRCPICNALQDPAEFSRTATWMHEDDTGCIAFVICTPCGTRLRLADIGRSRRNFRLVFGCGGALGIFSVAWITNEVAGGDLSVSAIIGLFVLWLAFGAALFFFAIRFLKVEVAE